MKGFVRGAKLTTVMTLVMAAMLELPPPAGAAVTLPEDLGSYVVQVSTVRIAVPLSESPPDPEGVFRTVLADVYVPVGSGPFGLIHLAHDYPGTRRNLAGWGMRLASRGFVVIVSDRRVPSAVDAGPLGSAGRQGLDQVADAIDLNEDTNSEDILRVVRWALAESTRTGSFLRGKVDPSRVAIGGHSLGGYYSTFAAIKAAQDGLPLAALVLLDPTDERLGKLSTGKVESSVGPSSLTVSRSLRLPTIVLGSEEDTHPLQCNMTRGLDCTVVSEQQYALLSGVPARYGVKVIGAHHAEVEDSGANPLTQHQRMFERYAMAWLEYWLQRDCSSFPYLGGAGALNDQQAGLTRLFANALLPATCNA